MKLRSKTRRVVVALASLCSIGAATASGEDAGMITAEHDGVLVASKEAEVTPIVDGWLKHIDFVPGQYVEQGEVLFRFSTVPQEHRSGIALADLEIAKSQVELAKIEADRARRLASRDIGSQARLDEAEADLVIAEQEVIRLRETVALNEINLKMLTLKAPFSGVISAPSVQINGWHAPNYKDDIRMATIKQVDPIHVRVMAPYAAYAARKKSFGDERSIMDALKLTLILPDGQEYAHPGRMISSGYEFDEETQKLSVWGEFPNPDKFLRPELKVRVRFTVNEAD